MILLVTDRSYNSISIFISKFVRCCVTIDEYDFHLRKRRYKNRCYSQNLEHSFSYMYVQQNGLNKTVPIATMSVSLMRFIRPLSLRPVTPIIPKVVERIIDVMLSFCFQLESIFSTHQFAYRKRLRYFDVPRLFLSTYTYTKQALDRGWDAFSFASAKQCVLRSHRLGYRLG